MTRSERIAFIALTVLALATTAAFALSWFQLWQEPGHRLAFVTVVLLLAFFAASWFGRWLLLPRMRRPVPMAPQPGLRVAVVTTIVSAAEPKAMVEQCLRAIVALDYPHDSWVLDEEDSPVIAELCERLGARRFSRKGSTPSDANRGHLRADTKHGNYNAWLAVHGAAYDVLAHLDPDHVPEPDFLSQVLGYLADPGVAFVQAPQIYYNQGASYVARGAAEESYDFYSSHQLASFGMGHPIFVGCHGTHRMAALRSVGGFPDHDADDLLLTLRYRAAGWRGVYVPRILAMGLTPVDWLGYLRQQVRWTRSVIDIKLYQLPSLRLPLVDKILGFLHGAHYLRPFVFPVIYLLLAVLAVSGSDVAVMAPRRLAEMAAFWLILSLIGRFRRRFALDPRRERGLHWRAFVLELGKWPYQCVAAWRAVIRSPVPYALTDKLHPSATGYGVLRMLACVPVGLGVAVGLGVLLNGAVATSTALACLIAGAVSSAIALYQPRKGPERWAPFLYLERRTELSDTLGPPRWPHTERRRKPRAMVLDVNY